MPLEVIHYEEFDSREAAIKRERELKTGFGRKWLKKEYEAGRLAARQAWRPKVLDMFAGRGAIPMEAQRLGGEGMLLRSSKTISACVMPCASGSWPWTRANLRS